MKQFIGALLVGATLLVGCASTGKGLIITAAALDAVGDQFVAASEAYTAGCREATRVIPKANCDRFREFSGEFKRDFPQAVAAWKNARAANDSVPAAKAEAQLRDLEARLKAFLGR